MRTRWMRGLGLTLGLVLPLGAVWAKGVAAVEVVAKGLENPWAMAFIGEGRILVTERPGRMRVVEPDGSVGAPLQGLPKVHAVGQGGLLDVITDRDFARNRKLFFCFAEPGEGGATTALASARLSEDTTRLEDMKVIFRQKPRVDSKAHFGCRIAEARDHTLFLTLGERFDRKEDAQNLGNHLGKLLRLRKDGSAPPDNPFAARPGVMPEIWSYGHRNLQGAAIGPDGYLWTHEHGPQGGDEVNRPEAGKNYGWPVITYGENYGGGPIGEGLTAKADMEQPLHYWVPSIAPSGMAFVTTNHYGQDWKGSLFVGSLKSRYLVRLKFQGTRLVEEEILLPKLNQRVRDVREGPDGSLYLLTDQSKGQLLRVVRH